MNEERKEEKRQEKAAVPAGELIARRAFPRRPWRKSWM